MLVDAVPLHQDPLGALEERPAFKRPAEPLDLGEPAERDVDRTAKLGRVRTGELTEHAQTRRLGDEGGIRPFDPDDHGTRRLIDEFGNEIHGMFAMLTEGHDRDVRRELLDRVGDVSCVREPAGHAVPAFSDDVREPGQALLALVGDEDMKTRG